MVRQERGAPGEFVSRIAAPGCEHFYIDGANTIQRFIEARLINEITRVPVLLGSGIALFGATGTDCSQQLVQTSAASNGLVQSQYRVLYGE